MMQTVTNAVGREIPVELNGMKLRPYTGLFENWPTGRKAGGWFGHNVPGTKKLLDSIDEAIEASGLKDGMTVSFCPIPRYEAADPAAIAKGMGMEMSIARMKSPNKIKSTLRDIG